MSETSEFNPSPTNTTPSPAHMHHYSHFLKNNLILVLLCLFIGGMIGYFFASSQSKSVQTISVIGKASQKVKADTAKITASTYQTGITVEAAMTANAKAMENIKTKLLQMGLNEKDIQIVETKSNAPYYEAEDLPLLPTPAPTFACVGLCPSTAPTETTRGTYSATTDFTITLQKATVPKSSAIIDMLAEYDIYPTIVYNLSNKNEIILQNKQNAINDAKVQAETLAKSSNAKIKKVIGIKETTPSVDLTYSSISDDPATDSYTEDIIFSTTFEVNYELSPSLFGM